MVFHWSLSDSNSPQVSRTRLSILAVLSNAVVWIVSIIIIIIITLLILEFFIPVLADSFPLEFEWQQVSSSLQDSPQYSGRSQQNCSLDSPYSSSYFQVLSFLYQSFGYRTKYSNCNSITVILMFHSLFVFFNSLARSI